jgi:UDP-N-acetylmuramate dehydrogenase
MQVLHNISLKPYNTFGIKAQAAQFAKFNSVAAAGELLQNHANAGNPGGILILGGGSNILFTQSFNGLVLKNEITGIEKCGEDDKYIYIKAGAGVQWHSLVMHCIDQGWAGLENLSLIPGSVGASPMQNIGAYGVEIKDVFYSLEAWHIQDKALVNFSSNDCAFGYRESVFKNKYRNQFVICSVTYRLLKQPVFNTSYGAIMQELEHMGVISLSIKAISQAVINIRSSKLPNPAQIGNAGSFFKNPEVTVAVFEKLKIQHPGIVGYALANGNVKLAAGWLIENCGPTPAVSWKGFRQGDAGCHSKQALVLVNYGNATGAQIYQLSEAILNTVKHKFDVQLEREVNIV